MYKTLATIALAAAAAVIPTPQSGSAIGAKPEQSDLFALSMEYAGQLVTLNAVSNGTIGNFVLSAGRPSVYPGTPAYFNGTGQYKALNFYLGENNPANTEPGVYGLGVTQICDGTPSASSAYAIYGFQQFEWGSDADGVILHKETEALNRFYACKDTASEGENIFLKWGDTSDGQPPIGCQETRVVRSFGVSS